MSITKRLRVALLALAVLAIAGLWGSSAASAYSGTGSAGISDSTPNAGGTDTGSGNNATPGGEVDGYIHSSPVFLGSTVADSSGNWSLTITIPSSYSGAHSLIFIDKATGKTILDAPITVIAAKTTPTTGPAVTGVAVIGIASLGGVLLIGGSLMLLAGRRRKVLI
jgi:hypothetical protein